MPRIAKFNQYRKVASQNQSLSLPSSNSFPFSSLLTPTKATNSADTFTSEAATSQINQKPSNTSFENPDSPSYSQHPQYIEDLFDFIEEEEDNLSISSFQHSAAGSKSNNLTLNTPATTTAATLFIHSEAAAEQQNKKYKDLFCTSTTTSQSDLPSSDQASEPMFQKTTTCLASKALSNSHSLVRSVLPTHLFNNSNWTVSSTTTTTNTSTNNIFKHFHSSLLGMIPLKYQSYNNLNTCVQNAKPSTTSDVPQYLYRKQQQQEKPVGASIPSEFDFTIESHAKQACGFGVGKKFAAPKSLDSSDYKEQCGEDAFFTFENDNYTIIGVADGVGGWAEVGVDPSLISNQLMYNAKLVCEGGDSQLLSNPNKILQMAYDLIVNERQVLAGSTTASIASYDKNTKILRTSNLGDSGLAVFREGACIFQTKEKQHYFNCPFQLGVVPPGNSTAYHDLPEHAVDEEIKLEKDDVLVMATDGVWDNLFPESVGNLIWDMKDNLLANSSQGTPGGELQACELARRVTLEARTVALNRWARTPFAVAIGQLGGKFDDITTVCFIA
ncbi:protein phosphatase [Naegleria gruberi]|uniref:Protein phosphatase n=1 Tax=Naegleria gruberi TaxID=5762 RepID=D2VI18_NAEGR|nr:protein phosphatase [Naegleria gruberi]EFC43513.1 protein phosphatase [Naegleria gruberi]|eukprot:XP_002676257.1 protein phosphatase [Naegleria gruberi strain NEG-M]